MPSATFFQGYSYSQIHFEGRGPRDEAYGLLRPAAYYFVQGAEYSEKYKSHVWDGYCCLLRRPKPNVILIPEGLRPTAKAILADAGWTIKEVESRFSLPKVDHGTWHGYELRDYQRDAVDKILNSDRGVLRLPIRSGKTMMAARAIMESKLKALFVVPSISLLDQSIESFRKFLPGTTVGQWGDGVQEDDANIVVITNQSFSLLYGDEKQAKIGSSDNQSTDPEKREEFRRFCSQFGILFVDEAHHIGGAGKLWREAAVCAEIPFKYGLSATVPMGARAKEDPGPEMWLRGACGDVIKEISMSDLVDRGIVMRVGIVFYTYDAEPLPSDTPSSKLDRLGKIDNVARNNTIVALAESYVSRGYKIMVDTRFVDHSRKLNMAITKVIGGKTALMLGSTSREDRKKILAAFEAGKIRCIVGNVLGEGVDLPSLEVVINAEGGKGDSAVIQRIRNATYHPTKKSPILVELLDRTHDSLIAHARARLGIYTSEKCFDISFKKI